MKAKIEPMVVRAIRWQAHGSSDVLDARQKSGAGTSKVHALAEPLEWDWFAWGELADKRLLCGRSTPRDEDWMDVSAFGTVGLVNCRRCFLALGGQKGGVR